MRQLIILFIIIFIQINPCIAQVWPGDVNKNGVVNNIDLLYIGNAYGKTGPKRLNATTNWEAQEISANWDEYFSGNINLAQADCNGDGIIDYLDFIVVYTNYNKTHDTPDSEVFISGIPNLDPQLFLNAKDSISVQQGKQLVIPINLGDDSLTVDHFNGIAFSIFYNPEVIQGASIQFNMDSSWINNDEDVFAIVQNDSENGVADVTVTRYGQNAISGSGQIGSIAIIIEDDVIPLAMKQRKETIAIDSIRMVDEFLNTTAIANDTILYIIQKDSVTNNLDIELKQKINISPNPVDEWMNIHTPLKIQKIEIYNLLGEKIFYNEMNNANYGQILVKPFSNGIHIIKLFTNKGVISKKVLIKH